MANYRQFSGSPPSLGSSSTCPTCNVPYEISDSPLVGFSNTYFSEEGQALFASSAESGIVDTMPSFYPAVSRPTQAVPNQTLASCPSYPNISGFNYYADLEFNSQQQSKGAILVYITLYKGAGVSSGHALPIRFQTRADYQDPNGWVDSPGLQGWVMNGSTTNQGYGGTWVSGSGGGGWREDGSYDTTGGGYGGSGTLQVHNLTTLQGVQNYLFAFDDIGDFRIISGYFQGPNGQCQDGSTAMQGMNWDISIESLYDGTGTLYDYYVTTSPSSNVTNDTTKYYMAYESYGKLVKQFYEYDSNGNLVPASLSGGHYWKRLTGVVNPSILNPESTNNGQYSGNLLVGTTGAIVGYSTITLPQ